jgi:hypothetical protein
MLKRILFALVAVILAGPAFAQQEVSGQLLTNPLTLPNPTFFKGTPATLTGNGQGTVGATATLGAIIKGEGSTSDLTIENKSGTTACSIATGATSLLCASLGVTSSPTTGDLVSWNNSVLADSGSSITAALAPNTTYWYPYGGCSTPPCSPTQTVNGLQQYLGSPNPVLIGPGAPQFISYNVLGLSDLVINPIAIGDSPSTIPSQSFSGKTFSLTFTSGSITGSPVTVTYTGTGADTQATVATNLCSAVSSNANLTNVIVCDATAGGGAFNLQWSVLINPVVASTGTGTISLASPSNNLDGVFWYHNRRITGYTLVSGDTVACDIYNFNNIKLYQTCSQITGSSGGIPTLNVIFDLASGSSGDINAFAVTSSGPLVYNSGSGISLYFANSSAQPDARMFENASGALLIYTGGEGDFVIANSSAADLMDFGVSTTGAWTVTQPLYLTGIASSGGNQFVCRNSTTGQINYQSTAC